MKRYSLQEPHGWNKGIVRKAWGECSPTIDASMSKQHVLIIERRLKSDGFGKDRFVMEKQVKRIGNLNNKSGGSFAGQVYDKCGLAPTLTDMQGGGRQPHIISKKSIRGVESSVKYNNRNYT